jgi:hypothetical protein
MEVVLGYRGGVTRRPDRRSGHARRGKRRPRLKRQDEQQLEIRPQRMQQSSLFGVASIDLLSLLRLRVRDPD